MLKTYIKIISVFFFILLSNSVMSYDLVIRNGTIVTAESSFIADLAIKDGKIAKIGANIRAGDHDWIDARGKLVMPGAIDAHVHFNLEFCGTTTTGWTDGTRAAASGGVTTIIDYAIQAKGSTLREAVESRKADAKGKAVIDYALHGGITDWNDQTRDEMNYYTKNGIPSFKMFMIYESAGWMADDATIYMALEETRESGGLLMLHAESEKILNLMIDRYHKPEYMEKYGAYLHTKTRPAITEYEAIQRAITLAEGTGGRMYIVHISTSKGANMVQRARRAGHSIWGETCPQYLLFTDEVFKRPDGHLFATCPQIKTARDRAGLVATVMSEGLSIIGTDDCTFNTTQKAMWGGDFTQIPFGMPGVETMVPTMYDLLVRRHNMPATQLVRLISTNPAKLFGMYPQKGALKVGSDADIVILDPEKTRTVSHLTLETKCDWSPYEGMELTGWPVITISRGVIVARDGRFVGPMHHGQFVPRAPHGEVN